MVTGDHPLTALSIARELGIATRIDEVVHGTQVESANTAGLQELIARARVFARVTPEQKLTIVAAAQAAGHFVAVTGDGVNDAPALRRANDRRPGRHDVAREAAGLVLSDDNFATIVNGIEEGRIAYQNIRNVVYLLVAAGVAEVLTVGLAVLVGRHCPCCRATPVAQPRHQWHRDVEDLAFRRGRGDELRQPPRPSREPISIAS
jgi:magnesium-transporting ATPase (P-type)